MTNYLQKKILPTIIKESNISKKIFPSYFTKKYLSKNIIFSQSDLGFHNIIKVKNKYKFIDFEYAGIDDPVKLISDFIIRPSNLLNKSLIKYWLNNSFSIFIKDKDLKKKLLSSINLFAICWILIILNDCKKQSHKIKNKDIMQSKISKLLLKTDSLLENISFNYYKECINEFI